MACLTPLCVPQYAAQHIRATGNDMQRQPRLALANSMPHWRRQPHNNDHNGGRRVPQWIISYFCAFACLIVALSAPVTQLGTALMSLCCSVAVLHATNTGNKCQVFYLPRLMSRGKKKKIHYLCMRILLENKYFWKRFEKFGSGILVFVGSRK